jgi:hypothetical protein
MTAIDYVGIAIAVAALLFMGIHYFFIEPGNRERRRERELQLQTATIYHLQGKSHLSRAVMNAKSMEEVADIVKAEERRLNDIRTLHEKVPPEGNPDSAP